MTSAGWGKTVLAAALLFLLTPGATPPTLAQGTATETVGFSIQVEPVFKVESTSDQGGNIEFPLRIGEPISRPPRILQRLEQPLSNEKGADMAEEPVMFTVTDGVQGGRSEVKAPQPLTTQPVVLFTSGPEGASEDFTVTYSVSSKQLVPAGSYRARILIEEEFR